MPRWIIAFVATLSVVLCACSDGANAEDPALIRVNTPTPTPIPTTPEPTPVPPELVLSTVETKQGGVILVSVTGDVRHGVVRFLDQEHPLDQGDQSMYSFVAVGIDAPPGPTNLRVEVETSNGSRGTLEATIQVAPTEWQVDYLELAPDRVAGDPELIARDDAAIALVYSTYTPEKLWSGQWLVPTEGRLTADFGSRRSVNGGPPEGHHSGTDIGAVEGTPIVATNAGRVVMVRQGLYVHGDMVIVDHGGGVLSGYAHMSEFAVAEGDVVAAGDLLGMVGNTGRSTGAHLHWEMSIDGVLVDPWEFVDPTNGF